VETPAGPDRFKQEGPSVRAKCPVSSSTEGPTLLDYLVAGAAASTPGHLFAAQTE
jgi:hypothetical protein